MARSPDKSWPELAFDGWMLASEMSMVIWLRSARMFMGGKIAENEARRMVSEKIAANVSLVPTLLAGGVKQSPQKMAERTMAHYSKPVRANRKRLSR